MIESRLMRKQYYFLTLAIVGFIVVLAVVSFIAKSTNIVNYTHSETSNTLQEEPQKNIYSITTEEREILARLVFLEANTESIECQKAIVSVVFNRLHNGAWGDSLYNVIYYPHQFTPAKFINTVTPTQTNYDAVDYVVKNGSILPKYCMYFRASYGFSNTDWVNYGYHEYKQVDNTFFGYFEKDK
jgi:hypothetical protein